jgi:hypothetical protein
MEVGGEAAPRSYCSQQYVRVSPLGSLPVAVSLKGVDWGIVKLAPALTVGVRFDVGVLVPTAGITLFRWFHTCSMLL